MKKKFITVISLALAFLMLPGCTIEDGIANTVIASLRGAEEMRRFNKLEYERPDMDEFNAEVDAVLKALEGGEMFDSVTKRINAMYEFYDEFNMMYNIAYIRSYQDVTDPFYAEEYAWCDEAYSQLGQGFDTMYYACAASELADELEGKYFWEGFKEEYSDSTESIFTPKYMALASEEAQLIRDYRALFADPTIELNGEEVHFNDVIDELYGEDYTAAYAALYEKFNAEAAEIFIKLIAVRKQKAEETGRESYEQSQYCDYFYRDYSPEDAENYVNCIKEHLVPLYAELRESDFASGLEYYALEDSELMHIFSRAVTRMGGKQETVFSYMKHFGLIDTEYNSKKGNTSFEVYLGAYEAPFLFVDTTGGYDDIITLGHEFGHCVEDYVNFGASITTDLSECYSQGTELLMLEYLDGELSDEALAALADVELYDMLGTVVEQAEFAEFESRLYNMDTDELSAESINTLMLELSYEYGTNSGDNDKYFSMMWMDVPHFLLYPFYVISYSVTAAVALQIYEMELSQERGGVEMINEMLSTGILSLGEMIDATSLESPFEEDCTAEMETLFRNSLIGETI